MAEEGVGWVAGGKEGGWTGLCVCVWESVEAQGAVDGGGGGSCVLFACGCCVCL